MAPPIILLVQFANAAFENEKADAEQYKLLVEPWSKHANDANAREKYIQEAPPPQLI